MKRTIILVFLLIFSLSSCTGFESVEEYNKRNTTKKSNITAFVSIDCKDALNNKNLLDEAVEKALPKDGVILKDYKASVAKGETAYSLILKVAKNNNIQIDCLSPEESSYNTAYIKGIGNLYEKDCGKNSGWIFYVNGVSSQVGCSDYYVKNSDVIEFTYVCDINKLYKKEEKWES